MRTDRWRLCYQTHQQQLLVLQVLLPYLLLNIRKYLIGLLYLSFLTNSYFQTQVRRIALLVAQNITKAYLEAQEHIRYAARSKALTQQRDYENQLARYYGTSRSKYQSRLAKSERLTTLQYQFDEIASKQLQPYAKNHAENLLTNAKKSSRA
jgi:hypothetical protein